VTVRSDLLNVSASGPRVPGLDVEAWITGGDFTIDSARALIAAAALKSKWFKSIPGGRLLSQFVMDQAADLNRTPFGGTLLAIKDYIYPLIPEAAPDRSRRWWIHRRSRFRQTSGLP
jgi:hypothetical protein